MSLGRSRAGQGYSKQDTAAFTPLQWEQLHVQAAEEAAAGPPPSRP